MNVIRITRPSEILESWAFINEGLTNLKTTNKFYYNELEAKKLICKLSADKRSGFIAFCYDDRGEPLSFGIMREDTLPFAHFRTFSAHAVYYKQNYPNAVLPLMEEFEGWCRANGIKRYSYISRRPTTAAKRCFLDKKYDFHKSSLVFEKTLT